MNEARSKFSYRKFRLTSDESTIYFELDSVWRNDEKLGSYKVTNQNGKYSMVFNPISIGPFYNIWVILRNGEKFILNLEQNKLNKGDTISLIEIPITLDDIFPEIDTEFFNAKPLSDISDGKYCNACQQSPCICSDPEKTSTNW